MTQQIDGKYVFCEVGSAAHCGNGICVSNGTECACYGGSTFDALGGIYPNCYMPSWVNYAYPISVAVLAALIFFVSLNEFRKSKTAQKRRVYMILCFTLALSFAFSVSRTASGMNIVSWVLFLLEMGCYVLGLVPTVIRNFLPSVFRSVSGYPRWSQLGLGSWFLISSVVLSFTWVYAFIGLLSGTLSVFNDAMAVWMLASVWLLVHFLIIIQLYVSHMENVLRHSFSPRDPQFFETNFLKNRASEFRNYVGVLGLICISLLFIAGCLHFFWRVYGYQFVIVWPLEILILILVYQIVWYFRTNLNIRDKSMNDLSAPKSSVNKEMPYRESSGNSNLRTTSMDFQRSGGRFRDDYFVDVAVV